MVIALEIYGLNKSTFRSLSHQHHSHYITTPQHKQPATNTQSNCTDLLIKGKGLDNGRTHEKDDYKYGDSEVGGMKLERE